MTVRDRRRWDWANMPELPAIMRADSFKERLKLVELKKRRAKGPKNHATNRERSREERARYAEQRKVCAANQAAKHEYLEAARAYWRGERDGHP